MKMKMKINLKIIIFVLLLYFTLIVGLFIGYTLGWHDNDPKVRGKNDSKITKIIQSNLPHNWKN